MLVSDSFKRLGYGKQRKMVLPQRPSSSLLKTPQPFLVGELKGLLAGPRATVLAFLLVFVLEGVLLGCWRRGSIAAGEEESESVVRDTVTTTEVVLCADGFHAALQALVRVVMMSGILRRRD